MADFDGLEAFDDQIAALEDTLGGAQGVAATFQGELARMRESVTLTSREVGTLSRAVGRGLRGAFEGLVFDGAKLSDALREVSSAISVAAYNAAITPVQNHVGGLVATGIEAVVGSLVPFANGGSFTSGRVVPFATGGVVSSPTYFPMRGGTGLMGEAGPEAIMPLSRGPDGKLGVRSQGSAAAPSIVMNITTPDAASFQRSRGQIAAQMSRALGHGQRNT